MYISFFSGRSKTQISHNVLLQVQPPPAFEACHHCDETRQAGASQQNVPGQGLWDSGFYPPFGDGLYDLYMVSIWFIYGVYIYMVYIWYTWFICGLYMVYIWFIHVHTTHKNGDFGDSFKLNPIINHPQNHHKWWYEV